MEGSPKVENSQPIKFVADAMLGGLTRWLRILGYDTLYDDRFTETELVQKAKEEGRIILTRRKRLAQEMASPGCVYIEHDHPRDQLRQVVKLYDLDPHKYLFSLCTLCNQKVVAVEKSEIEDKVPPQVFEIQENFFQCPQCGKIYWEGSHLQGVKKRLSQVFKEEE